MLLCINLLQGGGQYQLLGKIATHFPHFCLLIPLLKRTFRLLYIPPTPFYDKPPPCPPPHPPPPPLLTNQNHKFSWKSKLKHALTKLKKYLLETSSRASEASKLDLFTKINGL